MKRIKEKLNISKDYTSHFALCVLISAALYLILSAVTQGRVLSSVFFDHMEDSFMDFFNSVRDASLGGGAYTERKVIYPPMANLIFWLLSFVTPKEYNATSFDDRYTWSDYPANVALIWIFITVSTAVLALIVYRSVKLERKKKILFAAVAIFSVPVLNMLERGNIMIWAFIALVIYAVTYNSESALVRELGLVSLAFSFSLKLYPIMFAWILLADKRYKEFFRCAIYSLALLILPSFFFGGPSCLLTILQNILSFSSGTGNALSVISRYCKIPYSLVSALAYAWFGLCAVTFAVSPFVHKERWKAWAIGCITFLSYPALTSTYAWALFIIPIIYLVRDGYDEDWRVAGGRRGYLYPMLLPFLFFCIPMPMRVPVTVNAIVVYVFIVIIAAYAMYDTSKQVFKKRRRAQDEA